MNKYAEWLSMSTRLKTLKAKEMKKRKELCMEIFEGRVGKMKKKFEHEGYLIEAANAISYKLDTANVKAMWEDLSEAEVEAVDWKPDLKLAAYKKLDKKALLHECVIAKPAAPTLKVVKVED